MAPAASLLLLSLAASAADCPPGGAGGHGAQIEGGTSAVPCGQTQEEPPKELPEGVSVAVVMPGGRRPDGRSPGTESQHWGPKMAEILSLKPRAYGPTEEEGAGPIPDKAPPRTMRDKDWRTEHLASLQSLGLAFDKDGKLLTGRPGLLSLQAAYGLPKTGMLDEQSERVLRDEAERRTRNRKELEGLAARGPEDIKKLQRALADLGYRISPTYGVLSPHGAMDKVTRHFLQEVQRKAELASQQTGERPELFAMILDSAKKAEAERLKKAVTAAPAAFTGGLKVDVDGAPDARKIDPVGQHRTTLFMRDPKGEPIYVNAHTTPFVALDPTYAKKVGAAPGDIVTTIMDGRVVHAIYADNRGAGWGNGEGSSALILAHGGNAHPIKGGIPGGVTTIVFPGSGSGLPQSNEDIQRLGALLYEQWLKR